MVVLQIYCLGMYNEALNILNKNLRNPLITSVYNPKRSPYGVAVARGPHEKTIRVIHNVGLSHNTKRRGESVLSFSSKNNKTHNESNRLRYKFYHGSLKEKTTNSNSLKI